MRRFSLIVIIAVFIIYFSGNNVCGEIGRTDGLLPNVSPMMLKAGFWIENTAGAAGIVLTRGAIDDFNRRTRLRLPDNVYDLSEYPDNIAGVRLREMIREYRFPTAQRFAKGGVLTSKYWGFLDKEININGISDKAVQTKFGFTLKRTNLRTFPTDDFVTATPYGREFDLFQETALEAAEPVVVLHQGSGGRWLFVQTANYRGWLDAASVVLAKERLVWQEYVQAKDFLVVTGSSLTVGGKTFGMGVKLPLNRETAASAGKKAALPQETMVRVPARDAAGNLYFEVLPVDMRADVVVGYLPYTRANVIKQAFKMLGEPYDWGGRGKWRDCSSFIQDIYRVFGIVLPRNADKQENSAGKTVRFAGKEADREAALKSLKPGATLHMDGHVMLYLGEYGQKHYAIHSLYGYNDAKGESVLPRKVVVSDLSLKTRGGYSYLEVLTVGKNID